MSVSGEFQRARSSSDRFSARSAMVFFSVLSAMIAPLGLNAETGLEWLGIRMRCDPGVL